MDSFKEKDGCVVLYYLECIVILKCLQRPGVVKNFTVQEWKERLKNPEEDDDSKLIAVKEHKTASQQVATFVIQKEIEEWFTIYFEKVRPFFLKKKESPFFFISSSGEQIFNPSSDIARFQQRFGLKNVSSQVARRHGETYMNKRMKTDAQRISFAKLLSHSNTTAERVYREKTVSEMIAAAKMFNSASDPKPSTSTAEENIKKKEDGATKNTEEDSKETVYRNFLSIFPQEVDTIPPTLKDASTFCKQHGTYLYKRWRKTQYRSRVAHISGYFDTREPTDEELKRILAEKKWTQNLPSIKDIVANI
ncbi:hypothetical protein GDO86_020293 [Hymenochirus boettgeri]|uniref:Uncharacterized protein n=1 Tax=Hymenochirus boettgeri TaxID=247094 RepID=A0A8T2IKE3_9PIPI|nr:hypothetical protein GDO86_020293 [Hymenochirus boettgeri]